MKKIGTFLISGLMILLAYRTIKTALPDWFDWYQDFGTVLAHPEYNRVVAVFLLVLYLMLALSAVLAFARLMAGLAMDIISGLLGLFGRKDKGAAQTLDNTLIIDNPALKKPWVRFMETIFSAAVWLFFVYLFQTIVTTVMWTFGLERIYHMNVSIAQAEGTMEATFFALCTAVTFAIVLFLWAQWNYWMYGRRERRKSIASVSMAEVAALFSVSLATVNRLQTSKISSVMPMPVGLRFREIQVASSGADGNIDSSSLNALDGD